MNKRKTRTRIPARSRKTIRIPDVSKILKEAKIKAVPMSSIQLDDRRFSPRHDTAGVVDAATLYAPAGVLDCTGDRGVVLSCEGDKHVILDGSARLAAAQRCASTTKVKCQVLENLTDLEAEAIAFRANATHGTPLSKDDRKHRYYSFRDQGIKFRGREEEAQYFGVCRQTLCNWDNERKPVTSTAGTTQQKKRPSAGRTNVNLNQVTSPDQVGQNLTAQPAAATSTNGTAVNPHRALASLQVALQMLEGLPVEQLRKAAAKELRTAREQFEKIYIRVVAPEEGK